MTSCKSVSHQLSVEAPLQDPRCSCGATWVTVACWQCRVPLLAIASQGTPFARDARGCAWVAMINDELHCTACCWWDPHKKQWDDIPF